MSTQDMVDLGALLDKVDDATATELASNPEVDKHWNGELDVAGPPDPGAQVDRIPDLVAVVADMENSTKTGTGKHAASTASIYQASTGGVVEIFRQFAADFIQIQGDGAFALFWSDQRYERAMCAAITVQSFGGKLT